MIAVDTSLVVALFASWHEAHDSVRKAVPAEVHLPAHVLLESFSVLTRLPPPHRAPADVVEDFLAGRFQSGLLTLPGSGHRSILNAAVEWDLSGGSVYDALVAAAAKHAGATLLSRDRRAARTYEAVGVTYQMIG